MFKDTGDTVGELRTAEICVSYMPVLKAKKLAKLTQEKGSPGKLKEVRQQYPPFRDMRKTTQQLRLQFLHDLRQAGSPKNGRYPLY